VATRCILTPHFSQEATCGRRKELQAAAANDKDLKASEGSSVAPIPGDHSYSASGLRDAAQPTPPEESHGFAPIRHTCPRTEYNRQWVAPTIFSSRRPRIGVDVNGIAYEDHSNCKPALWPSEYTQKERIIALKLAIRPPHDENLLGHDGQRIIPAPPCPRLPRIFSRQFRLQFLHIPEAVLRGFEDWHIKYGKCLDCIVRAMRSLPPWAIELYRVNAFENGNPVYLNGRQDELVEWDEDNRCWQHLVLDHHSWVRVEDLERREYDQLADPEVVNGTVNRPIPICIVHPDDVKPRQYSNRK
jgi:hypothetical protein